MKKILEIKNVSLTYQTMQDEIEAIKDLTFHLNEGDFLSIIGPSGCGKTTVLSLIAGLLKPTKGEILINDSLVNGVSEKVGYMLQKDHLFQWRTVEENAYLPLEIHKAEKRQNHTPRLHPRSGCPHRLLSGCAPARHHADRSSYIQPPVT